MKDTRAGFDKSDSRAAAIREAKQQQQKKEAAAAIQQQRQKQLNGKLDLIRKRKGKELNGRGGKTMEKKKMYIKRERRTRVTFAV